MWAVGEPRAPNFTFDVDSDGVVSREHRGRRTKDAPSLSFNFPIKIVVSQSLPMGTKLPSSGGDVLSPQSSTFSPVIALRLLADERRRFLVLVRVRESVSRECISTPS